VLCQGVLKPGGAFAVQLWSVKVDVVARSPLLMRCALRMLMQLQLPSADHDQGIGKLVCDARAASGHDPVVLPYFHR